MLHRGLSEDLWQNGKQMIAEGRDISFKSAAQLRSELTKGPEKLPPIPTALEAVEKAAFKAPSMDELLKAADRLLDKEGKAEVMVREGESEGGTSRSFSRSPMFILLKIMTTLCINILVDNALEMNGCAKFNHTISSPPIRNPPPQALKAQYDDAYRKNFPLRTAPTEPDWAALSRDLPPAFQDYLKWAKGEWARISAEAGKEAYPKDKVNAALAELKAAQDSLFGVQADALKSLESFVPWQEGTEMIMDKFFKCVRGNESFFVASVYDDDCPIEAHDWTFHAFSSSLIVSFLLRPPPPGRATCGWRSTWPSTPSSASASTRRSWRATCWAARRGSTFCPSPRGSSRTTATRTPRWSTCTTP